MQRKKKLKWKHISGILKFCLTLIPAKIASIFAKERWLVQEDDNEARDNGYWMFKYIRENHPEQKCYYVLNKTSPDYEKVAKLGKVLKPHSFKHWWHYIIAKKVISSQTGGKPCPAFVNKMENLGLFKTKTYFLQHGVTVNDVGWLYHKYMKVKLFLTTTKPEDEFIKSRFGHPENVVQCLGFPRFDGLYDDITDKDMILIMPTWRNYING
ncbi:MAG: CDP-glycerol glycerophosphotransferase family protein, partial [Clostridia bacterium]|nr:CDP-glycerol glycerophosphotransferase family protein [Clostridia bacterium]